MGAVPKRRISTGRRGRRRSAIKLKLPTLSPCPNCGQPKPSHLACAACGYYKGKQVIKLKEVRKSASGGKPDKEK